MRWGEVESGDNFQAGRSEFSISELPVILPLEVDIDSKRSQSDHSAEHQCS